MHLNQKKSLLSKIILLVHASKECHLCLCHRMPRCNFGGQGPLLPLFIFV